VATLTASESGLASHLQAFVPVSPGGNARFRAVFGRSVAM